MEPDYLQYANKLMDRLRTSKPKAGEIPPAPPPTQYIINAPKGCVIVINGPQPEIGPPNGGAMPQP